MSDLEQNRLSEEMNSRLPSPSYFNLLFVLAAVFHLTVPTRKVVHPPYTYVGLPLILFALALNVWSSGLLRDRNTSTEFHGRPTRLVTTGPFRVSRNPTYLSGVIVLLGLAVLLGSAITFGFPVLLFVVLNRFYVPAEEMVLERTFGLEYAEYKRRVRRWL